MPIPLHEVRERTFSGTRRRIFQLFVDMGTSNDIIWPFAAQPFMRSPGPMVPGRTEEWHNGFHAVLEASKSVAEKLRQKSGLTSDGADLVDAALAGAWKGFGWHIIVAK